MNRNKIRTFRSFLISALLGLPLCLAIAPLAGIAKGQAPDNTSQNKDRSSPTADDQKMNSSDRALTQKIRKAIHDDNSLSTYAHNVKIISQDGKVTLRGPVRSAAEKATVASIATLIAGEGKVTNQLEVAPQQ